MSIFHSTDWVKITHCFLKNGQSDLDTHSQHKSKEDLSEGEPEKSVSDTEVQGDKSDKDLPFHKSMRLKDSGWTSFLKEDEKLLKISAN